MGVYIGHFPTLYPDEIIYSVFARYCKRVRSHMPFAAVRTFFGRPYSVPVELPSHLDALLNNLPQGHPYTSDLLIDRHTTFPFYSFFLDAAQREAAKKAMRGAGGAGVRSRLGITAGGLNPSLFMRHCPVCDTENRRIYGETYWHRLHQIAGIDVCPKHQVLLENSNVPRGVKARNIYVDAEYACPSKRPRDIKPRNLEHELSLNIAIDAAWLLDNAVKPPNLELIHEGYDFALAQTNLASYAGVVKTKLLITKIMERYPAKALLRLDCMMDVRQSRRAQWVSALLYAHGRAQSPIRHLLLINFLGMSMSTFTTKLFNNNLQASSLFGSKPWNCLNPICKDYCTGTIQSCSVENDKHSSSKVIGRFHCISCGFTYSRFGPDRTHYNLLGNGWVNEYGTLWHEYLQKLWMDDRLNMMDVAAALGVTRRVVKKQATRWNLPFPKPGQRVTKLRSSNPPRWKGRRKIVDSQTIDKMRSEWLTIIMNPAIKNIKIAAKLHGRVYRFLQRHDPLWLITHPLHVEKITRKPVVDWDKRDDEMIKIVALAASKLVSKPGKPVIVTQLAICREIGTPIGLYNMRSKMPKFAAVLKKTAETKLDFAIRRISWAAEEIRHKGNAISKSALIHLAGSVARKLWSNSTVKAVVENACQE